MVDLTVERSATRADVAVGDEVRVRRLVEVPPGAGTIVAAEWDFEGAGDYPLSRGGARRLGDRAPSAATHTFAEPGTYFPARAGDATQRQGDVDTPHARIENLGRVRVVVGDQS